MSTEQQRGFQVKLIDFAVPNANGLMYSYENFQRVVNAQLMARVTNKSFYGELFETATAASAEWSSAVSMDRCCLRMCNIRLTPAGLSGLAIPAGPLKEIFREYATKYAAPLPLRMRAFVNQKAVEGSVDVLDILSFDLVLTDLMNHPKVTDAVTVEKKPYVKPELRTISRAEYEERIASLDAGAGQSVKLYNNDLTGKITADAREALDELRRPEARGLNSPIMHIDDFGYIDPALLAANMIAFDECVSLLQHPLMGNDGRKSITLQTAGADVEKDVIRFWYGATSVVITRQSEALMFETKLFDAQETNSRDQALIASALAIARDLVRVDLDVREDNQKVFNIVKEGLEDPDVIEFLDGRVTLDDVNSSDGKIGDIITFTAGSAAVYIRRTGGETQPLVCHVNDGLDVVRITNPNGVSGVLWQLVLKLRNIATPRSKPNKEPKMSTTTAPKKPTAKAVFKKIDPIVSKNVIAHFDEAFRIRRGTKFDGYLKKLDGKSGAFVRIKGDDDIYALPYTVTSQKKAAGERSLRSALATRDITIVDTDDLKGLK